MIEKKVETKKQEEKKPSQGNFGHRQNSNIFLTPLSRQLSPHLIGCMNDKYMVK
jgi:hypothetical protein